MVDLSLIMCRHFDVGTIFLSLSGGTFSFTCHCEEVVFICHCKEVLFSCHCEEARRSNCFAALAMTKHD